jgi:hypothetical protein
MITNDAWTAIGGNRCPKRSFSQNALCSSLAAYENGVVTADDYTDLLSERLAEVLVRAPG